MNSVTEDIVRNLLFPKADSHKGQNGKLLIIGGSHLFHAASLWSLTVASRIVDLVHYSSVAENNQIVHELKKEFRDGIVVPRKDIEDYIAEDDAILIGPGMMRTEHAISNIKYQISNIQIQNQKLKDILNIQDEGELTGALTNYLLKKYPDKQWIIDAGALQMMDLQVLPRRAILTPHHQEFEQLTVKDQKLNIKNNNRLSKIEEQIVDLAKRYNCIVLLKGKVDIISNGTELEFIEGGNAGMTKGGTGDVLAGLIASLSCKNDPWTATLAGSFINKRAGDELYKKVGPFFNASDLAHQIPETMKNILL